MTLLRLTPVVRTGTDHRPSPTGDPLLIESSAIVTLETRPLFWKEAATDKNHKVYVTEVVTIDSSRRNVQEGVSLIEEQIADGGCDGMCRYLPSRMGAVELLVFVFAVQLVEVMLRSLR